MAGAGMVEHAVAEPADTAHARCVEADSGIVRLAQARQAASAPAPVGSGSHDPHVAAVLAHLRSMPPVAALGLRLEQADDQCLVLSAPLAANVNDKGCAFGGSLVSLLTLAGWSLVTLRAARAGLDTEVYVAESRVRYLKPLHADLRAQARALDEADWDRFIDTLRSRGRARISIVAEAPLPDGGIATACESRYAAFLKQ